MTDEGEKAEGDSVEIERLRRVVAHLMDACAQRAEETRAVQERLAEVTQAATAVYLDWERGFLAVTRIDDSAEVYHLDRLGALVSAIEATASSTPMESK